MSVKLEITNDEDLQSPREFKCTSHGGGSDDTTFQQRGVRTLKNKLTNGIPMHSVLAFCVAVYMCAIYILKPPDKRSRCW